MRLPVQHLECQACGRRFADRAAFERHKDAQRQCVAVNEQYDRGLELGLDGLWRSTSGPTYVIGRRDAA